MNPLLDVLLWITYFISLYFSIFLFLVYLDKHSLFSQERSQQGLPRFPLISVIVPAYNEEKTIVRTLQSIAGLDYPPEKLEVVIVNDGSTDGTLKKIQEYIQDQPSFRCISQENKGKAAALNRALQGIKGEFFACLDADSFVERLTLKKMLSFYFRQNDARLAIVTPAMKVDAPQNLLQKVQWLEYIVMILFGRITSHLDSLYVAPGPFSLYRTDIIRQLGGFDENSITEDQEIAYRIQQHQYTIKQCFDGYVYTTAPSKLQAFYRQRRRWYLGSMACIVKYRKMIGNTKYGDFGMMQLVKNLAGYFLAITGISIFAYLLLRPFFDKIRSLFLVQFQLAPYLKNFHWNITLLDVLLMDYFKGFIVVVLLMVGAFFFYAAHKNAKEKMAAFGWIPILPYFVFYYLVKGSILLFSIVQFHKSKKW